MRLPLTYAILLGTLAALGIIVGLVWFGVVDIPAIYFAFTNIVLLTLLLVFAVLGGAFVGMLFTHRLLTNREFSPIERTIMQTHGEVKALSRRLAAMERRLEGTAEPHDEVEEPDAGPDGDTVTEPTKIER